MYSHISNNRTCTPIYLTRKYQDIYLGIFGYVNSMFFPSILLFALEIEFTDAPLFNNYDAFSVPLILPGKLQMCECVALYGGACTNFQYAKQKQTLRSTIF